MSIDLAILATLLAINFWATSYVLKHGEEVMNRKTIMLVGIWLFPYVGAFAAMWHARPLRQAAAKPAAPAKIIHAPSVLLGSNADNFDVQAHLQTPNNVPILDWNALQGWAVKNFDADRLGDAMQEGRKAWLLHLRDALGPMAQLHETDESLILSSLEPRLTSALADYIHKTRRRIEQVLNGVAQFPQNEKSILIVFETQEDYYHYVSIYYPDDGEFALSGGVFIDAGCPHFATVRAELTMVEPVIAHEMTHMALSRLRLPKWLDEGIAVNTEHRVAGPKANLYTPRQLHRMHLEFWDAARIQEFWSGQSFDRTDEGNMLSYDLGRIIVELLSKDWAAFASFVTTARNEDAGAAAAQEAFGLELGAVAASLLEQSNEENWAPAPDSWAAA